MSKDDEGSGWNSDFVKVFYKNDVAVIIFDVKRYSVNNYAFVSHRIYDFLPYSHKLWMLASEFSMTPLDQREDKQYQFQFDNGRYLDSFDARNIHGKPYIRLSTTDKYSSLTSTDKSTFDIANRFLDGHVVERDADDD